ncbi:MAG: cytochrome c oxidase subunit I, partial [Alphaproteobacteria bacterium]
NHISSVGAYISAASTVFFVCLAVYTIFFGRKVSANYWGEGATTLEWQVSSPPPFHQFGIQPVVV